MTVFLKIYENLKFEINSINNIQVIHTAIFM